MTYEIIIPHCMHNLKGISQSGIIWYVCQWFFWFKSHQPLDCHGTPTDACLNSSHHFWWFLASTHVEEKSDPVHSLMVSTYFFFSLPLLLVPSTVPWKHHISVALIFFPSLLWVSMFQMEPWDNHCLHEPELWSESDVLVFPYCFQSGMCCCSLDYPGHDF